MKKNFIKISYIHKKFFHIPRNTGLTFIELIVVMAIFTVLSTVTLFKFSSFSSNVTIQTVSQDIALKIVQSQKNGSTGTYPRLIAPTQSYLIPQGTWIPSFGVHFEIVSGNPANHFVDFFDGTNSPDNKYNPANVPCTGQDECLSDTVINSGDQITSLCIEVVGNACVVDGVNHVFSSGDGYVVPNLDIIFSRPNLSAKIFGYDTNFANMIPAGASISSAKILIYSQSRDQYKIITVYPVGQITVD